jgi:hypothetical protein
MVGLDGSEMDIDVAGLRDLYKASVVAQAALDHFGRRRKNSGITTVDRLQERLVRLGHEVSRNEVVDLLRTLGKLGCGKFVVGRRGGRSRLRWSVGLREVGQLAAGEDVAVPQLETAEHEEGDGPEAGANREHRYWLRPELEVLLELPPNLTASEASRLADFIRTLPMA